LQISEFKQVTREKFFSELGVTYGNFTGKNKNGTVNSDLLAKIIVKYPDISPKWLITGEGNMIDGMVTNSPENGLKITDNDNTVVISKKEYAMLNDFWAMANTLQKEKEQQMEKNEPTPVNTFTKTVGVENSSCQQLNQNLK
jgi:hypothetical protein